MRVLLDEDVPHKLRKLIPNHEVATVAYMKWDSLRNGALLRIAEDSGFEVFVTADKELSYQQNLKGRSLALVVLSTPDWNIMKAYVDNITTAINAASSGTFQVVDCGKFQR